VFRRLIWRVGRRGAALLFFALLDLIYAFSLAFPSAPARHTGTLAYIAGIAPLWAWAALWATVGLACCYGAFRPRDRTAYALAAGLKVLWGATFLAGWIFAGIDRGYVSAAVWLPMAGWVYIISTWPEVYPDDLDRS
jgi:hypothetical protein